MSVNISKRRKVSGTSSSLRRALEMILAVVVISVESDIRELS